MIIPHQRLSPEALHGLIEEVVTRDGTQTADAEPMVAEVVAQLERGKVVITYDLQTRTCNIVPADAVRDMETQDG